VSGERRGPGWRWLGVIAGLLAIGGIWRVALDADRAVRTDAAQMAAEGAAGFLSLVVPADASGAYDVRRLLSNAALLASSDYWRAGLQVTSGVAPLLPEPAPDTLVTAARVRAVRGGARAVTTRRGGEPSVVVPLRDRGLRGVRGSVEAWNAIPPAGVPFVRVALTIAALLALALFGRLAGRERVSAERRLAWLFPVATVGLLGLASALAVEHSAAAATDASLDRARRLAEVSAVSHRRTAEDLARVAPGMTITFTDSASRDREVRTADVDGAIEATASGILSGDHPVTFAMVPVGARLDPTWLALAGWVLLLAAAVAASLWAEAAAADPRRFRRIVGAWGFLAPAAVHLLLFTAGPLLFLAWLSLHRWGAADAARPFVGWDNFETVLADGAFWRSLALTAAYALYVPVTLALALGAALLLHRGGWSSAGVTGFFALPILVSGSAAALAWGGVFRGGHWLAGGPAALAALAVIAVWTHAGYQVVLFRAALGRIPRGYGDAAMLDGAGGWRRFRWVTWPLLRPTVRFVVVSSTAIAFQGFTAASVLAGGGPAGATDLVVPHIYREGWDGVRFGTAGAMALVFTLILGALLWSEWRWLREGPRAR
jgi:multiple sugar transport system permease protein